MIKLKDILNEETGERISYKGRNYFVGPTKVFKQVFVFQDKELTCKIIFFKAVVLNPGYCTIAPWITNLNTLPTH